MHLHRRNKLSTNNVQKKLIQQFQSEIFIWYTANKRNLPWRLTQNPYAILISELMLQQTQVSRVIPKYFAWMKKFPTIESLAMASTGDILHHWSGLGYNRRALYLQRTAKQIVTEYKGHFPDSYDVLVKLPGIGVY